MKGMASALAGVYPASKLAFNAPAVVMLPVTASLSNWPAPVPPNSIFKLERLRSCTSPVIASVPVAPVPPGLMLPWLTKPDAPVPTAIVPVPDKVPVLVKPAAWLNVAALATLSVPALVGKLVSVSVPAFTFTCPLLSNVTPIVLVPVPLRVKVAPKSLVNVIGPPPPLLNIEPVALALNCPPYWLVIALGLAVSARTVVAPLQFTVPALLIV